MIETIWAAIRNSVGHFVSKDGTVYEESRDPFSFEFDPRGDSPAFYLDPPQIDTGAEYVGGASSAIARATIWLSRQRGEDADRQAVTLATDCGLLRRLIDEEGLDWFVLPGSASVRLITGDTAVTAALSMMIDFEEVD